MKKLAAFLAIVLAPFCMAQSSMVQPTVSAGNLAAYAPTAVGSLPTCNAAATGNIFLANNLLTPTVLGTVVGGGAVSALVHCNGTSWIVG